MGCLFALLAGHWGAGAGRRDQLPGSRPTAA